MVDISSIQTPALHPHATRCARPKDGNLKWIGGNLGLDYPVCEDVLDSNGTVHYFGLNEVLLRLDDFEGFRGNMPVKDWLITMCFTAYEYKLLTSTEVESFENYVRNQIGTMPAIDIAKRALLGHRLLEQ